MHFIMWVLLCRNFALLLNSQLASLGVPLPIPILKSHATYNDNDPRVVSDDQAQPNDQVKIRHKLAFGKETRESTLAGLRSGMSIQQCVNAFGVSRKTVYKWQKQHLISEQGRVVIIQCYLICDVCGCMCV